MDPFLNAQSTFLITPYSISRIMFQGISIKSHSGIPFRKYLRGRTNAFSSSGITRMGTLVILLLCLTILKCVYNPYPAGTSVIDGSFYYQIARHVSEGNGLLTSVSLYHQGLKHLPQLSTIYPLWPLVLGSGGAVFGIETAASVFPELFFIFSLILLYGLANKIAKTWGNDNHLIFPSIKWLDLGHLAVILLGLNGVFFQFTSLPYTDALAFSLCFGTLLALFKIHDGNPMVWGAVSGVLAGLAYLSRSQMLGLVLAIPIALFVISWKTPSYRRIAATTVVAAMLTVLPWIVYLWTVATPLTARMFIDFAAYQETPELATLHYLVDLESPWEIIKDRVGGLFVAFNFTNQYSYFYSFGPSTYIPLMALGSFFLYPQRLSEGIRSLRTPYTLGVLCVLLTALGCLAPVHAYHGDYFMEWLFRHRHGLPFFLLILVAIPYLLSQKDVVIRSVVLCLLFLSILINGFLVYGHIQTQNKFHAPTTGQRDLAAWIEEQTPSPVFVTTKPWELGAVTRGVFHWVQCHESETQMVTYFEKIKVDHLITKGEDLECSFFQNVRQRINPIWSVQDGSENLIIWKVQDKT